MSSGVKKVIKGEHIVMYDLSEYEKQVSKQFYFKHFGDVITLMNQINQKYSSGQFNKNDPAQLQ